MKPMGSIQTKKIMINSRKCAAFKSGITALPGRTALFVAMESAGTCDGTGSEFHSWQCRIKIISHICEPTITEVPLGFISYTWLDTKFKLKNIDPGESLVITRMSFHP